MSEYTHVDLQKARESRKVPRWKLASEIGVSETTLERWETGRQQPTPEDVGRIETALGADDIWYPWMYSNHDSFRAQLPRCKNDSLLAALVSARHEVRDVMDLQDDVERDALDGSVDDAQLKEAYKREATEAITMLLNSIKKL